MPRYPEYKDSGVGWLGVVPLHWDVTPLKYLVTLRSGGTPSKDKLEYWNGDLPWASAKDLKVAVLQDTQDHISQCAVDAGVAELVPAGSVLIVVRGMILAKTFPVSIAAVPMAINQDLKALDCRAGIRNGFVARLLEAAAPESSRLTDEAGHGTKALRMETWTAIRLPVPPEHEQASILAFLDHETAKIDSLIAEQQNLIALLKAKRQAVISHAVTKGLDPNVPMKDSGVEWLGEVPAHWKVKRVKHLVRHIAQGWSPQCESFPVGSDDEVGVLKVGCVNGGVFNPGENKVLPAGIDIPSGLEVRSGDLLVSRANTRELVGSAAVAFYDHKNLLLCDKLYRLRLDPTRCKPSFVAFYLGTGLARSQIELDATGASSSMVNIGQATILDMPIPVPSIDEQGLIQGAIDHEVRGIENLLEEAIRIVTLLSERRVAVVSAAVTGQIDVRGFSVRAAA